MINAPLEERCQEAPEIKEDSETFYYARVDLITMRYNLRNYEKIAKRASERFEPYDSY